MALMCGVLFLYTEQLFTKEQMLAARKFFDYRESVKKILEIINDSDHFKSL
jgi:hypothetical protein